MSHLGRLPPLHAIGRSQCVDLEDPPDLLEEDVDQFLEEYDGKAKLYVYGPEHPLAATKALEQHFRLLSPGSHMCRNIPETATAFTHSKHSVAFSSKYAELRHLLQTQARLQLIRDYASRLNAATMFVKDIETLVREEYAMWYSVCHHTRSVPPVTKLECLSAICEDLRIHMNHWNSVKQMLYTDPWLRPQLPSLILQMHQVQTRLYQLRSAAIWWLDRLIQIGFRVLAHCDLERIEADSLWCITRGLEDFNSIVSAVKTDFVVDHRTCFSFEMFNSYQNIGAMIKAVPFGRVLNMLASERARYASASTHLFFTSCTGLLKIALGKKGGGCYNWSEEVSASKHGTRVNDTSDYHTASGSHISLGTVMLQVGGISAPDLSEEPSPLMDFARREKTFAQKFLQIVCHSTTLLLRRMPAASSNHVAPISTRKRSPLLGQTTSKKCDGTTTQPAGSHKARLEVNPEPPPRSRKSKDHLVPDGPEVSKKSSGTPSQSRKSVSWSDAGEVSVIQQLLHKYMDMLWQYFGGTLADQFIRPVWGGPDGVRGQLGSTVLCSDLVLEVIAHMMQHTCAKDIFPPAAAAVLNMVTERIQVSHAWRAWDLAMCSALASAVTDKCHPVLLADGEHSSNTAKCLRDAFHPLHSALHTIQTNLSINSDTGENNRTVCLALAVPTVHRLVTTCDASLHWCSTRGLLYLESWTLGAFLLVTQSDFKVRQDVIRRVGVGS
ncbi:hypothetical protein LSH36_356g06046 [Paralvinella palmiformis]|uniref:Coiled-coil protein 142 C-terminal domain-containing protein n=1 Tax=Paralvinella palmiformis TaxID=53620 RepID=A0AAD9JFG0_9ANNE|nr:hypothetical protein LSH36_356g06046 [Paralvinella palmiformis]